jgi:CspA family cold shock protein
MHPETRSFGLRRRRNLLEDSDLMAEGTIKKLTDKGFGFIDIGGGDDIFFHSSALVEVSYEELREGQRVTFTEGQGPKGPRAENVKPV